MTRFERRALRRRRRRQDERRFRLVVAALCANFVLMLMAALLAGCQFNACDVLELGCQPPPPAPPLPPGAALAHWEPRDAGAAPVAARD